MGIMKSTLKTGAGLAALAAAAGAYFLTGKRGEKNLTLVKGWMLKMKGDVLDGLEKIKDINEEAYQGLVDKVAEKYKDIREANEEDFDLLLKELRNAWSHIHSGSRPPVRSSATGKSIVKRRRSPSKKHGSFPRNR